MSFLLLSTWIFKDRQEGGTILKFSEHDFSVSPSPLKTNWVFGLDWGRDLCKGTKGSGTWLDNFPRLDHDMNNFPFLQKIFPIPSHFCIQVSGCNFSFFAPRTLKIATRHSKEFQNGVRITFLYSLARTRHIITFLKRQNELLVKITIQDNYGSFDVNWNIFMISEETSKMFLLKNRTYTHNNPRNVYIYPGTTTLTFVSLCKSSSKCKNPSKKWSHKNNRQTSTLTFKSSTHWATNEDWVGRILVSKIMTSYPRYPRHSQIHRSQDSVKGQSRLHGLHLDSGLGIRGQIPSHGNIEHDPGPHLAWVRHLQTNT